MMCRVILEPDGLGSLDVQPLSEDCPPGLTRLALLDICDIGQYPCNDEKLYEKDECYQQKQGLIIYGLEECQESQRKSLKTVTVYLALQAAGKNIVERRQHCQNDKRNCSYIDKSRDIHRFPPGNY